MVVVKRFAWKSAPAIVCRMEVRLTVGEKESYEWVGEFSLYGVSGFGEFLVSLDRSFVVLLYG